MKAIRKRFKKGTAVALTAALLAGLVPALPGAAGSVKAAGGTTKSPSVSTYATKAQLMDDTFKPGADGTATNYGKLVFGKNSSDEAQEWYILGQDKGVSEDNTILFAASPIAQEQKFNSSDAKKTEKSLWSDCEYYGGTLVKEVLANHYGASEFREALKTMATNTSYFTPAEQELMNPTTVTTLDVLNVGGYFTTDKLYALAADGPGSSDKTIKAGSDNSTVVLAKSSYWSSGEGFWLRSPYKYYGYALLTDQGDVFRTGTVDCKCAVQPASNLDLSSVLFATLPNSSNHLPARMLLSVNSPINSSAPSLTQLKRSWSISLGTVQSPPRITPTVPVSSSKRFVSSFIACLLPL